MNDIMKAELQPLQFELEAALEKKAMYEEKKAMFEKYGRSLMEEYLFDLDPAVKDEMQVVITKLEETAELVKLWHRKSVRAKSALQKQKSYLEWI